MIGSLYIVATPIGHLDDLSKRALDILQQVDVIACEDTRHSQRLCQAYNINKPLIALHQHNERKSAEQLIHKLFNGENVALVSDAGTPLVSDPGAILTALAHKHGIKVIPIPGASSVMTALCASGLSAGQFVFAGFIPVKAGERHRFLQQFNDEIRTTIFFEAPHRMKTTLTDMLTLFAPERILVIARELTKQFEEICQMPISEVLNWIDENPYRQKGEFVLMLEGANKQNGQEKQWQAMVDDFVEAGLSSKMAANLVAKYCGVKKKNAYQYLIDKKNK